MKVTSRTETVKASDHIIFAMVSNCNNFGKFLPDQVKDWESTEDFCKFAIPGVAVLTLTISEKIACSKVVYHASNDKNLPLTICIQLDGNGEECKVEVEIEVEVPIFLNPMVKKPLQNLVEIIVDKIKLEAEKC
ncbi:MAG: hypothetical protein RR356_02925 [Bacteroidales bacterium]